METVNQALEALRSTRDRTKRELTQLEEAIRTLQKLAVDTPRPRRRVAGRPRRKMSAAARRKIAAAQRVRWAKIKKQKAAA